MKTAVVTGGTRGIGRAVVSDLAAMSWRVVFLGRGGGASAAPMELPPHAKFVAGDLSTLAGVKDVAQRVLAEAPVIDALVHNAGIWPSRRQLTEDGLERAFAVNHIAPFVLNRLLEDALAKSKHRRVVVVSAGLYVKGRIDSEDVTRTARGEAFHPLRTYADTKLCNLLLLDRTSKHFAERGITINAVHPGVIRTGLGDRGGLLGLALRAVKLLWKTPEEGAQPVVRLVTLPAQTQGALTGVTNRYFHLNTEMPLAAVAKNEETASRLWDHAEELWLSHNAQRERAEPLHPTVQFPPL